MNILGIEAATVMASVGVVSGGKAIEKRGLVESSHARSILPLVDAALTAAGLTVRQLDLLAVSLGPGSFTGLRIALSTAKGLALATGANVIGVPTLEAYAAAIGPRRETVWPVLDARKGEVYAAGYRWTDGRMECLAPPATIDPATLAERLGPESLVVGDGVDTYGAAWREMGKSSIEFRSLGDLPPSGAMVARLGELRCESSAAADVEELEPTYCRRAEAEVQRERRDCAVSAYKRREN